MVWCLYRYLVQSLTTRLDITQNFYKFAKLKYFVEDRASCVPALHPRVLPHLLLPLHHQDGLRPQHRAPRLRLVQEQSSNLKGTVSRD